MESWWRQVGSWLRPRLIPTLLVGIAVILLAWLALRADDPVPPSATEYTLVVLFSTFLNVLGGTNFARIGRANPSHARSAVRTLITIGRDIEQARNNLSGSILLGGEDAAIAAREAGPLLDAASAHLEDAILDWNEVHSEALQEVLQDRRERS